jgi:hypothetical protein
LASEISCLKDATNLVDVIIPIYLRVIVTKYEFKKAGHRERIPRLKPYGSGNSRGFLVM